MKKLFLLLSLAALFATEAGAQIVSSTSKEIIPEVTVEKVDGGRRYIQHLGFYGTISAAGSWGFYGGTIAYGFRNYNPDRWASFFWGAEVSAFLGFGDGRVEFKSLVGPQIGATFFPRGFKLIPYIGAPIGFSVYDKMFVYGVKAGLGMDFTRHFGMDFNMNLIAPFNGPELNIGFVWRF